MPEPVVPGANRRVHHSSTTVSAGVQASASQGPQVPVERTCSKPWLAASASSVNTTTTRPVAAA